MTLPCPVTIIDDLLLGFDKYVDRTHSILLRWTAFNPCKGRDAIIDDDADLWVRGRSTFEELELDVGGEGGELRNTECSIFGYVGVWWRSARGKTGQIEGSDN